MPSWDDPVGPVKIVFLVDTWETDADRSDVVELLDIWIGLVRAGRGSRNNGYKPYVGHFTLDANYGVTCQFDINVSLLRGTVPQMSDAQLLKRNNEINTVAYEQSMVDYQQQVQAIGEEPGLINPPSFTGGGNIFSTTDLLEHTKWVLRRAWCGGYKLSDLNYQETQVTTVEATFYPETIERNTATYIYGAASAISNQP